VIRPATRSWICAAGEVRDRVGGVGGEADAAQRERGEDEAGRVGGGCARPDSPASTIPRAAGARHRAGPRIVVGYRDFAENETLAWMYAGALRGGGYRVRLRSVHGLRPEAVSLLRHDKVDIYPDYSGSLLRYLVGTSRARLAAGPRHTLGRIDAEPERLAPAQDRNAYVTKSDTAARLRLTKLSDLARYWPK
jgi:osmoprotectant transport system substrate-binding protein